VADTDQAQTERVPSPSVAPHHPVLLQRQHQAMRGGPRETAADLQLRQRLWTLRLERAQDGNRLVEYPDAA